jgi:hypothetical protein
MGNEKHHKKKPVILSLSKDQPPVGLLNREECTQGGG